VSSSADGKRIARKRDKRKDQNDNLQELRKQKKKRPKPEVNHGDLIYNVFYISYLQRKSQTPTLECVSEIVQDMMVREAMLSWITWLLEVLKIWFFLPVQKPLHSQTPS